MNSQKTSDLAKKLKPPPPFVVKQTPDGSIQLEVDRRQLESPSFVYAADAFNYQEISGLPTLYFCQFRPSFKQSSLKISNVVALSMSRADLVNFFQSVDAIQNKVDEHIRRSYGTHLPQEIDSGVWERLDVSPQDYRKLPASFLQFSCLDDRTELTVFHMEHPLPQALEKNIWPKVSPVIQILLPTVAARSMILRIGQEIQHFPENVQKNVRKEKSL